MDPTIRFNHPLITFGVPLLLMLSMALLSHSSWFLQHPETLSTAITFDLALTVPLVYLFLIWKRPVPKTTTIPVFVAGLILASYSIPAEHQFYLAIIKHWMVPVVELAALTLVALKAGKVRKAYKAQKNSSLDFHTAIRQVAREVFPQRVDKIFAFEISLLYYGFLHWKTRKLKDNEFSYHRKSGTVAILAVFIGIIWIETFVIHILLQQWSPLAAWILTGISLYSGFQVFGMLRSLSKRPVSIREGALMLRYGIMGEACIPLENIRSIALSSKQFNQDEHSRKLSPLGDLEGHNVLIHLKDKNLLEGLYGTKKRVTTIALHIDEKERFTEALSEAMQEKKIEIAPATLPVNKPFI